MDSDSHTKKLFGGRFLSDSSDVFEYNAWDCVSWNAEQTNEANQIILINSSEKLPKTIQDEVETNARQYWNKFYSQHENKFFKDRSWIKTEFNEIFTPIEKSRTILEVGCGVGNTVFPILHSLKNQNVFVYACDFSEQAIDLLKNSVYYDTKYCFGFTYDITQTDIELPCPRSSLDYIIMIFVLSAVNPNCFAKSVQHLTSYLKPGGILFFRDYGRCDLAQLRFKKGKCLSDHFYLRSDGTRAYFFTQDELHELFTEAGLNKIENKVDRRLIVNRKKKIKMFRVWIQCKYVKI